ncbi:MAG: DUF805 domain-containing protein [Alphaproteobacteria bacterium]|nr:DUF805 domain-containing protein [Alphaproteobacteria bacterium]
MPTVKKTKTTTRRTTTRKTTTRRVTKPVVTATPRRTMVGPLTAIKNFWVKYFDFMGRSTRSEFWFGLLFVLIMHALFYRFGGALAANIADAVMFIPLIALFVRRFRDAGLSVWWYLIPALLVFAIPVVRGATWYRMLAVNYVSSGMLMYSFFFFAFLIFEIVVACLPTQK